MGLRAPAALFFLWIVALGGGTRLPADDDIDAAARLLDAGWRVSATANRQIDEFYRTLPPSSHLDYAYALAKLRQFRNEEALDATAPLLDDPIHGLYARRMRIWLLVMRKRLSDALLEMEQLAQRLPDPAASEDAKELRGELVVFLGRVAGFLRGPARDAITDFEVESRVRRIVAKLSDDEKGLFEAESRSVVEEFEARAGDREKMIADATRAAEEEAKRKREELAALREKLNDQIRILEDQQRALNEEAQSELNRIAESDQPLRSQLASLESEAAVIRNDMANVWFDINLVESQLANEDDPAVRDYLLRDLSRLWSYYNLLSNDYSRLDASAAGIHAERGELAAQQQNLEVRHAQRTRRLGEQRELVENQLRRADREETKLNGDNVNIRRAARSQESKLKALPTYLPFPAEAERDRLLGLGAT